MKVSDYIDVEVLMDDLDGGYLREQTHPTLPLAILNYTNKAQIEGHWTDATKKCRGLIYNYETNELVARPFAKFFNHNQPEAPAWALWDPRDIRVQDKADGSLGIIYPDPNQVTGYAVATRGSFTSDQAVEATKMLNSFYRNKFEPEPYATYLVEIVYPENRIVVDYGQTSDLFLLDILDTATGRSLLAQRLGWTHESAPFPEVDHFDAENLLRTGFPERKNAEGYVLTHRITGERVKIKGEEYKRLHKLITGVTEKTIWELLSNGESVETLLDVVPDEFYDWVHKTADSLNSQFNRMYRVCFANFLQVLGTDIIRMAKNGDEGRERRKMFAQAIADSDFKDVMFGFYDDRDVSPMIWKRIRPAYSKPFWNQSEDNA
jgi:RNA ligase